MYVVLGFIECNGFHKTVEVLYIYQYVSESQMICFIVCAAGFNETGVCDAGPYMPMGIPTYIDEGEYPFNKLKLGWPGVILTIFNAQYHPRIRSLFVDTESNLKHLCFSKCFYDFLNVKMFVSRHIKSIVY